MLVTTTDMIGSSRATHAIRAIDTIGIIDLSCVLVAHYGAGNVICRGSVPTVVMFASFNRVLTILSIFLNVTVLLASASSTSKLNGELIAWTWNDCYSVRLTNSEMLCSRTAGPATRGC